MKDDEIISRKEHMVLKETTLKFKEKNYHLKIMVEELMSQVDKLIDLKELKKSATQSSELKKMNDKVIYFESFNKILLNRNNLLLKERRTLKDELDPKNLVP